MQEFNSYFDTETGNYIKGWAKDEEGNIQE